MWRKMIPFFAAFFFLGFGLTVSSCKKKNNPIGKNLLNADDVLYSDGIDTFSIVTYTELEDSVITKNPEFNMIGSLNDATFGRVDASFYTQLLLSGFSPDFGILADISIDSAVLAFEFGGYYGKEAQQLFEVYELADELHSDSAYKSTSTVPIFLQNLVPTDNNQGLIKPDYNSPAIVGNDTTVPLLRIPIDTVFARNLLTIAESATNDQDFLGQFKGLYVKTNSGFFSPNQGGVTYLSPTKKGSKLTVYYTKDDTLNQSFDFVMPSRAIDFNHVEFDHSGSAMEQLLTNPELGQNQFYAQALTSRAKIEFPSLESLPKDAIIHRATLEIPVDYFEGDDFYISSQVVVTSRLFEGDNNKYLISTVDYNKNRRSYIVDLRNYMQNYLKGEIQNSGLYVSPRRYNTTVERIIFNGPNSTNKKQPKLNIVYTEF